MVLQHFALTHYPLGKAHAELWDDGPLARLQERFQWLLESPGVGVLSGEPGVGKTTALRSLTAQLNPHRYQVVYLAETDFGRLDLYRSLALALGLEPAFRRAALWREIKARILDLADGKGVALLWIIDEAHNLPVEFFRDLPAFLNFAFDSRDLMAIWLLGHPRLAYTLERAPYAALAHRIQVRLTLKPVAERERFKNLIEHALRQAGAQHTLVSDSGLELLRHASQGVPRQAGNILKTGMQLAMSKGLNHLPDELIQQATEELR
jgi:type II secretory pathway predicted ATPase ExeA